LPSGHHQPSWIGADIAGEHLRSAAHGFGLLFFGEDGLRLAFANGFRRDSVIVPRVGVGASITAQR
jgi:hypothetical protein